MTTAPIKVRVPKAAELVAAHLREQIINSLIPKGDSLPHEAEMIGQYNVSRPTLREAFRILESEGLITISRGSSGARVHLPKVEVVARHLSVLLQARGVKLDDVYQARALIEPPAARLVAERHDDADIAALLSIIDQELAAIDDDEAFGHASNEFHRKLVQIAGVQTLGLVVDMLNEMLERHFISLGILSGKSDAHRVARRKTIKAQQKLVTLLKAGGGDEAETFWREHLIRIGAVITKLDRADQDVNIARF